MTAHNWRWARERRKRRRDLWHAQGGLCHWCSKPTVLTGADVHPLPADAATIDHVYHRSDPRRYAEDAPKPWVVMACRDCNHRRGIFDEQVAKLRVKQERVAGKLRGNRNHYERQDRAEVLRRLEARALQEAFAEL